MAEGEWRNGLFDHVCGGDCGTCMGAWWCGPCLYGRTDKRLENFPSEEQPGMCESGCWLMCGAMCCHLHWLPALFKRGSIRDKFGIKGDGCTDCLASYFCFPCTLAQMETELKDRASTAKTDGGAGVGGYHKQEGGMVYQQPDQHQNGHQNGHMAYQQGPPKY